MTASFSGTAPFGCRKTDPFTLGPLLVEDGRQYVVVVIA